MRYFLSDSSPVKYLTCGNLISKDEFLHLRRSFDVNVFLIIKEGTLFITQNGIPYTLGPNEYLFLKAGEEHYGYRPSSGKLSYMWVHFLFSDSVSVMDQTKLTDSFLKDLFENSSQSRYIIPEHGKISLTKRAPLLFNQLLDLSRQEVIYPPEITDYALSLLLMEISQEFTEMHYAIQENISPGIALIMEWVKANYLSPISIGEIAEEFGYNPNYLSYLFKKNTGISLTRYIQKVRIDTSKSLITGYGLSIKEAAYSCGFTDEKYYMKIFKKLEGMTPAQYKKAFMRKMINH